MFNAIQAILAFLAFYTYLGKLILSQIAMIVTVKETASLVLAF